MRAERDKRNVQERRTVRGPMAAVFVTPHSPNVTLIIPTTAPDFQEAAHITSAGFWGEPLR